MKLSKTGFKIVNTEKIEDSFFDRQKRIDWWSQDRLRNAKVMVVGAGAIGNEVLKNLALLGIGRIFVVDFDTISKSNLSRTVLFSKKDIGRKKAMVAARVTKRMCLEKTARVDWFHGDLVWELGVGIYQEMDIVLGCLDNVEARLAVNRNCRLAKVPWIDAGITKLRARVNLYEPEGVCYQCNLSSKKIEESGQRYSCDNFKKKYFEEGKVPTVQIAASFVAAVQVQEAIKYLSGQYVPFGKMIYYQGLINDFDLIQQTENPTCEAHNQFHNIKSIPFSLKSTLGDLLKYLEKRQYSGKGCVLDLRGDRSFIKSVACKNCKKMIKFYKPAYKIFDTDLICRKCKSFNNVGHTIGIQNGQMSRKEIIIEFDLLNTEKRILKMSLKKLGFPHMHVISVRNAKGQYQYYKLSGDKPNILPNF